MTYPVKIQKDANLSPIGSLILEQFQEEAQWTIDRGYKFDQSVDQSESFIYSTFEFYSLDDALMFKLTWGGR